MPIDIEMIAKQMADFAVGVDDVRVEVDPEDPDDVRMILAWISADLPADTAESLCLGWAQIIRKSLPERLDGWSSAIVVIRPLGSPLGVYFMGWTGHDDAWDISETPGETDSEEWDTLYQRLDEYLCSLGTSDSQGNGDFFLFDEDYGTLHQSLTIYRIEFLTRALVEGIQAFLKDGYADWSVSVILDLLPPVEGVASDGIDIYANRIVENWDRARLAKRLGKRLKF